MPCSSTSRTGRSARAVTSRARRPLQFAATSVGLAALLLPAPAAAQSPARFAVDSVLSIDTFRGQNVSNRPQVIIDVSAGVRLGDHVQAYIRPWFRLPRPNTPSAPVPDWSHELYQAGIRYERPGRLATRVDVGYNVSPIGLGIVDIRPSFNPVIGAHISYLSPMPSFDPAVPRVSAIAATYPLGGQVTVSSARWDARGAMISSTPTRIYAVGRPTSPRQTSAFVGGAGITPVIGLRLGVSFARGDYATSEEVTGPTPSSRSVTMVGGEGEYAFGYTKISGEVVRSRFERSAGSAIAYEWFVQGLQTLSPRWFVAARHEATSAPPLVTAAITGNRSRMSIVEAAVGFRATTDVTLRSSYYTRKGYGASAWDRQIAVSAVWARKWW
jgi:hypothetical protein